MRVYTYQKIHLAKLDSIHSTVESQWSMKANTATVLLGVYN